MKNNDRKIAVLLLLFAIWWGYHTLQIPSGTIGNAPGPKFFPMLLVVSLALLSIILFFKSKPSVKRDNEQNKNIKKHVLVFLIILIYIYMIELIGFKLATIPSILILVRIMGQKRLFIGITTAVGITFGVFVLFKMLLGVPLPM